ncbi:hypothetical protein N9N32_00265 [Alphaproteobacteria bacterium]|nr:hypothetical protein [Alphaproteobacteria bacterium]
MSTVLIDGDTIYYRVEYGDHSIEEAKERLDNLVERVIETCFADEVKIAVKGSGNFRNKVFSEYKANRKRDDRKKARLKELHQYMCDTHGAIRSDGMEADDLLRIWAHEANYEDVIIASIDKDLWCIAGTHYLIHKDEFKHVDENEADLHYWQQVLKGDPVDNIPGLPGIGDKRAATMLEGTTIGQRKQVVVDAYKEIFQDDWHEKLMETGQLIHILRKPDDFFNIDKEAFSSNTVESPECEATSEEEGSMEV